MKTNDYTKYMTTEERLNAYREAAYREYMRTHDEFNMSDYYTERISGRLSKSDARLDESDKNPD